MSQGFASGFMPGLQLGTQIREQQAARKQAEQLALLRNALLQQSQTANLAERSRHNLAMEKAGAARDAEAARQHDLTNSLGNARLGFEMDKEAQRGIERQQTSEANADFIAQNLDAPGMVSRFMESGDFSPEGLLNPINQRRDQYAQMTPEGQKAFTDLAKRAAFDRLGEEVFVKNGEMTTRMALANAQKLIAQLPPEMDTPQNRFNIIAPIYSKFHMPSAESMQLREQQQNRMQAEAAYHGYSGAKSEHAEAVRARESFEKSSAEDRKITKQKTRKVGTTLGMGGKEEPDPNDTDFMKAEAARATLKKLIGDESAAKQRRTDAFRVMQDAQRMMYTPGAQPGRPQKAGPQGAKGAPATPGKPESQIPDQKRMESAADQAIRELPNADEATQHRRMLEILGQNGASPYEDERSEPDEDTDPLDMDDAELEAAMME